MLVNISTNIRTIFDKKKSSWRNSTKDFRLFHLTEVSNSRSLSGDGIVPLAMNRTFEMYSVKGLSGTVKDGKMTLSLSFGSFPVTYKGTLAE